MQHIKWVKMVNVRTERIPNCSESSFSRLVPFGIYLRQVEMNKVDSTKEEGWRGGRTKLYVCSLNEILQKNEKGEGRTLYIAGHKCSYSRHVRKFIFCLNAKTNYKFTMVNLAMEKIW